MRHCWDKFVGVFLLELSLGMEVDEGGYWVGVAGAGCPGLFLVCDLHSGSLSDCCPGPAM